MIRTKGNYVMGIDTGWEGGDYSCYQLWRKPGKLRRFFRRIGIDRSTWELKLEDQWFKGVSHDKEE